MPSITIRNLDQTTKDRLRARAARHQRSMEEEVRQILRAALKEKLVESSNLAESIVARFQPIGGVELNLPRREVMRQPPEF